MRELNAGKLVLSDIGSSSVKRVKTGRRRRRDDGGEEDIEDVMTVGRSFQTDFKKNFVDGEQCWKQGTQGYVALQLDKQLYAGVQLVPSSGRGRKGT